MSNAATRISYALSKQVPDMERGFTIQTNYGDLVISDADAAPFVKAATKLLEKKLELARKAENRGN